MSLCLSLLFTAAAGAQQLPPGMKLEKVDVQGSSLFTPAEVAKMAGLRIGQNADLAGLSKAASALAAWGYFAAVQFSYRYTGTNLTVTFQLGDEKKLLQSIFDNFASLRDEEIVQAIRQDYPSFAGKVPGTGTANRFVQEKIEGLLAQKGSPSPVSFVEAGGMGKAQMVFRQEGDTLICAVRVQSVGDAEADVLATSAKLQKQPYSRQSIAEFYESTLVHVVRGHGYWRSQLVETTAMVDPSCSPGTTVLLRFNSGSAFSWGTALWDGNQKQLAARLDELTGLKRGETADLRKIEAGLLSVAGFYRGNGFLDFVMTPRSELDDVRREVNYRVQLKEGEQYRMGEFVCLIPPGPGACDGIKSQWKIRAGDLLDGAHFDQFQDGPFAEWKTRTASPGIVVNLGLGRDSAKRVANILVFTPPPR